MNLFDILIVTVLAYGLIRGIFRGLVGEASSIVGVLGGFYAAYTYYARLSKFLISCGFSWEYLNILSYLILFVLVIIVVNLLSIGITYLLKITCTRWVDRFFGGLFGFLKGVLVTCVFFIVLTTFLPKGAPIIKESLLAPYVGSASEVLIKAASDAMRKNFSDKLKEFKKDWRHT
ncbi:CvpA family protein [Desulfosarcina sp. OttesenSCG-928-G10]|nr:CvpA family protein [Desulfosarcina sp. OttesenSCG-928-G10]